jgi:heterodisulfide reductase subunit A-like polyferredoxin
MTSEANGKVGAALVIGGGVGGMQTALDLAEAGIKVYLLDSKSSIGGVMAQLDKTFPTNDCSMCIVSPRLVDVGRHLNIETITNAELESLEGGPGNFKAKIKKKARYIDLSKCTGCNLCAEVCPVKKDSEFELGLAQRTAIYRRYPQAVPSGFTIDKIGNSPCRFGCPLGVNAHAYVTLIGEGRFAEAMEVEKRRNPFPAICGRVCPHPCETECRRGDLDEPIAILNLKRFLADWEVKQGKIPPPEIKEKREEKVAIVGSGPAGLSAARELALAGYQVTVFEKQPVPGGMLALAIPSYRLPKDVLNLEIDSIRDLGVEIKTNTPIGADLTFDDLRNQGYQAIFIATGASKGLKLKVPGEDEYQGIMDCVDFLARVNLGQEVSIGKKVVVIGGGNAAMDSARTAWRLGAQEVNIVYNRSRKEMPAMPSEIEGALEEGVKIQFLSAPVRIMGKNGKVTGIECVRMELSKPDAVGRCRPVPVKDSEFTLEADTVISAFAQEPDFSFLPPEHGLEISRWNMLEVHPVTLQTSQTGIFAGGDAVSGPSTVVEAIGMGQRAAVFIHRYLQHMSLYEGIEEASHSLEELFQQYLKGEDYSPAPEKNRSVLKAVKDITGLPKQSRKKMPKLPVEQRKGNFKEVELGFTEEMAVEEARRCLNCAGCCECLLCVQACEAKAINHEMEQEKIEELNVGAVVASPGFELFNADHAKELGYGRYPDVLSSLQFERILSASGPYMGKVLRPSDGNHPKRIAWIQCVGSREVDRNYCSSVCCMYATKEAVIAKEHEPDLDCTIFYIDMRAFGKGFDDYFERAKKQGVKYIRSRPSAVKEVPGTHNLRIQYRSANPGEIKSEEFDMVVLSCALLPPPEVQSLSQKLGIELNEHGFCKTNQTSPVETTRPGVFACGPFTEPKDIPETVTQASGAASKVMSLLATEKGTLVKKKEYPPEKDVSGQELRIGVFICHCGKNIGGVIDSKAVAEYAATLPGVVFAEDKLYACSEDSIQSIKDRIPEHDLNRVVVASCTPRTHEPLFRDSIREAGLNPYFFEMANIRDQNTWVHMHQPEQAFKKAKDLTRMAVAKARLLEPLYKRQLEINYDALVIGGGLSGMTAALELAEQGFDTHLIEKENALGGNMRKIHYFYNGESTEEVLAGLIERVNSNSRVHLHLGTKIKEVEGSVGNFKTTFSENGAEKTIEHGVIIVATGAEEYKPKEYLYGEDERVVTQLELEEKLVQKEAPKGTVVMIQCVGSRDEERPYCSRVCCQEAVKNALKIKELSPDTKVYVLYRDIRTYGFRESYYRKAREQGVVFIRYEEDEKPEARKEGGRIKVKVKDGLLRRDLEFEPDLLVLSAGVVPRPEDKELAQILKVSQTQEGFFLEAHMKLRPVDFANDGIFVCGLAHAAKAMDESIAQAAAAAGRASTVLSKPYIELEAAISEVVDANCDGCAYCVDPCPYNAISLIEYMYNGSIKKVVESNPSLCKGCGVCMATCPKQGIFINHFKPEQIMAQIEAALEVE